MEESGESSDVNYSVTVLKLNEYQIQMNRLLLAVIAGTVAGILRIEGVMYGVGVFSFWNILGSAIMAVSLGKSSRDYFPNGARDVFLSQNFSGLMTFILVWTLVYDIVHIF